MADYDSNMVKPVEGLHNITGLAPTRRREERKRRQQSAEQKKGKEEESAEDQASPLEGMTENEDDPDSSRIDYCA